MKTCGERARTQCPRIQQLYHLMEVGNLVAGQLALEPLLQLIVNSADQLLAAKMSGLIVLNEDQTAIQYFKVAGWNQPIDRLPTGQGVLRAAIRVGRVIRIDNVRRHPHYAGIPAGHPSIGAFLSVPLLSKEQQLGALFVSGEPGDSPFTKEDERLLVAFAAQATIAIENARLYAKAEELARLRERQRIAQALHDTVAQNLFRMGLDADWCLTHWGDALPDDFRQRLQTIHRLTTHSGNELRSAIFALRSPFVATGDGLVQLINAQVKEFQAQTGIATTLIVTDCFPVLSPLISEAIYRIVCESLLNVRKHASASGVMVSLSCNECAVTVTVQDNGIGIPEPEHVGRDDHNLHFGVATMLKVTTEAEGDFSIANNDDQGVIVRARFPISRADL